jgi:hypothetical protein
VRAAHGRVRQADELRPAQQVVRQACEHGAGRFGAKVPRREVRKRLVLEVCDHLLDDGVVAVLSLDQRDVVRAVGDVREVAPVGPELGPADRRGACA